MVAIPTPHSGLLPRPGVLWGAAGVGLSHVWGGVLHGVQGWPWPLMGAVPWMPRALDIFGNQWTKEKSSPWCWAQPRPESAEMWLRWGMAEPKENPVPWVEVVCMEVTGKTVEESRGWRYPQGPDTGVTSQTRSISLLRNLKHSGKDSFVGRIWAEMCRAAVFSTPALASTAQEIISRYFLFPTIRKVGSLISSQSNK